MKSIPHDNAIYSSPDTMNWKNAYLVGVLIGVGTTNRGRKASSYTVLSSIVRSVRSSAQPNHVFLADWRIHSAFGMGKTQSKPEGVSFYAATTGLAETSIDGAAVPMSRFDGRVTLVVNVATS